MSERAKREANLPFWPRYLSKSLAALYVGVGEGTFDLEVSQGWWPPPRLRGGKGGRLTWDRSLLDAYADRDSALGVGTPAATGAPVSAESGKPSLAEKMNATLSQNRPQRGAETSQRRNHH
ncbi:hypothetical protein AA101099_1811 [Neoasaia chiangmaiensis NBRC 101099]|uniref:DNA-binding protein n=1 Tax=Neoasaia chiangmaiensis TaxID=320497 RepID=UPI0011932C77|nr:DNA-binding protein [Neoasaia chiangmaiensis]GBR39774.1 hypothetical protein AA101099_1811 [Neoasaia chiangmaiensis NBRC 101099]GEN14734.1 hypothetical protein NCH01_11650 [Neoasaia chiangmaiensis]